MMSSSSRQRKLYAVFQNRDRMSMRIPRIAGLIARTTCRICSSQEPFRKRLSPLRARSGFSPPAVRRRAAIRSEALDVAGLARLFDHSDGHQVECGRASCEADDWQRDTETKGRRGVSHFKSALSLCRRSRKPARKPEPVDGETEAGRSRHEEKRFPERRGKPGIDNRRGW